MPCTLITGQPGHGKSLLAISLGLKYVREGRPVYVAGFKELDHDKTGFKPLPFPFNASDREDRDDQGRQMPKWQLLPHGSVIMLDECYDVLPQRPQGSKVPPHVEAIARHRHHGYDIVLVCQQHKQLDTFVQGLIDPHIHVRRKFGLHRAVLKTWDRFQSNTAATDTLSAPIWKYPKEIFGMYTSATMHTVKRKIPWFIWAVPVLIAIVTAASWYAKHGLMAMGTPAQVPGQVQPGVQGQQFKGSMRDADDSLRQRDYVKWMTPRVAGQPWTAPAWDQLQPQGTPDLYCIAVEDGRCECRTEQGTKYQVKANICRSIAADGVYNPFRKPVDRDDRRGRREPQQEPEQRRGGGDGQDVATGQTGGTYWPATGIPQSYDPPQHIIAKGGNQ